MIRRSVVAIAILISFGLCGLIGLSLFTYHIQRNVAATTAPPELVNGAEILQDINTLRASRNIAPLTHDERLDSTSLWKAEDMATYNYFGHVGPDGKEGYQRVFELYPSFSYASENIAECWIDTASTFKAWLASPSHFAGMTNSRDTLFGSASVYDKDRHCVVTVNHFGVE